MRIGQFITLCVAASAVIGLWSFQQEATALVTLLRIIIVLVTFQVAYFIHLVLLSRKMEQDVLGSGLFHDETKSNVDLTPRP